MRTAVIVSITILLGLCVAAVAALAVMHDNIDAIVAFIGSTIIPTIVGLFAYREANSANTQSAQAVKNTNGILHHVLNVPSEEGTDHDNSE